jgi:hypothetical protein
VNITENLFVNGINNVKITASRHYQQAGDDGSVSVSGLVQLTAGDVLTLRFAGNPTPVTFQSHNVNFTIVQVT